MDIFELTLEPTICVRSVVTNLLSQAQAVSWPHPLYSKFALYVASFLIQPNTSSFVQTPFCLKKKVKLMITKNYCTLSVRSGRDSDHSVLFSWTWSHHKDCGSNESNCCRAMERIQQNDSTNTWNCMWFVSLSTVGSWSSYTTLRIFNQTFRRVVYNT